MHLFIVAAVVCMYGLRGLKPVLAGTEHPELTLVLVGGQVALVGAASLLMGWILGRLAKSNRGQKRLAGLYRRVSLAGHIVLLVLFAADIYLAGWAALVEDVLPAGAVLVDEILIISPLLLSWLMVQAQMYVLDKAIRLQAAQAFAGQKVWSRGRYVLFHIQAGMGPVLIPLSLLIGLIDSLELLHGYLPNEVWGDVLLVSGATLGLGLIILCTPLLIRLAWGCQRLEAEPLRSKLEGLCSSRGLRYREILIWRTSNMVSNAAVMGFWGPLRYLMITDALLKQMSEQEVTGVFAHEVGHVTGHHLPYYGLFMVGINLLIYDLLVIAGVLYSPLTQGLASELLQVGLLMGGFLGLFGWISRRFERDADVRAVEHAGCPTGHCQPGCPLYDLRRAEQGDQPRGNPGDRLCPQAASVFAGALQRIGLLNGIPERARSWRHSSIATRTELLYCLAREPGQWRRFRRMIRLIKLCIWALLICGAAAAVALKGWQ